MFPKPSAIFPWLETVVAIYLTECGLLQMGILGYNYSAVIDTH